MGFVATPTISPSGTTVPSGFLIGIVQYADSNSRSVTVTNPLPYTNTSAVSVPTTIQGSQDVPADIDAASTMPYAYGPQALSAGAITWHDNPNFTEITTLQPNGATGDVLYTISKASIQAAFSDWCAIYDPNTNLIMYPASCGWSLSATMADAGKGTPGATTDSPPVPPYPTQTENQLATSTAWTQTSTGTTVVPAAQ